MFSTEVGHVLRRMKRADLVAIIDAVTEQRSFSNNPRRRRRCYGSVSKNDSAVENSSGIVDDPHLTHVDRRSGDARMVDVSGKRDTRRTATAVARVRLDETATRLIAEDACKKGDVLATARLAGVCAAKQTWQLIPLCHQVRLDAVTVDARLDANRRLVRITASAVSTDRTGVEMECLTACSVAALTVYDMVKAVSRHTVVEHVKLLSKTGGKVDYFAPDEDEDGYSNADNKTP